MPIIDRHLVFSFFLCSLQVIQRPPTSSGFSSAVSSITPGNFTNFRPQTSKGAFVKGVMTSASPAARPAIGEPVAPTCSSLPDQPTNRSKVCQVKTPVLLGSSSSIAGNKAAKETLEGNFDEGPALEEYFEFENSPNSIQSIADSKAVKETLEGNFDEGPALEECFEFENSPNSIQSIADSKAVKETLEGNFDEGPALEECFEFENSPNSIQSVKGRLKAHFSFWVDA